MIGPGGFMMAPKAMAKIACADCHTLGPQFCDSCARRRTRLAKKRTRNSYHPSASGGKWITPARRWAIYERDRHRCMYCDASAERLTLDHRRPVAKGGSNASSNLLTCCLSCNSSRKGLSTRLWYRKLAARGIDIRKVQERIRTTLRRKVDIVKGQQAYERLGRKA